MTILPLYLYRYVASDVVKLDVLLNGQPVDAMATIVHSLKAQRVGRELVDKLKKFIDRFTNFSQPFFIFYLLYFLLNNQPSLTFPAFKQTNV